MMLLNSKLALGIKRPKMFMPFDPVISLLKSQQSNLGKKKLNQISGLWLIIHHSSGSVNKNQKHQTPPPPPKKKLQVLLPEPHSWHIFSVFYVYLIVNVFNSAYQKKKPLSYLLALWKIIFFCGPYCYSFLGRIFGIRRFPG